jgi:hypothetical protein
MEASMPVVLYSIRCCPPWGKRPPCTGPELAHREATSPPAVRRNRIRAAVAVFGYA